MPMSWVVNGQGLVLTWAGVLLADHAERCPQCHGKGQITIPTLAGDCQAVCRCCDGHGFRPRDGCGTPENVAEAMKILHSTP